jgi:hypothetical protein
LAINFCKYKTFQGLFKDLLCPEEDLNPSAPQHPVSGLRAAVQP